MGEKPKLQNKDHERAMTTFRVSPAGSDQNSGTEKTPLQTLFEARTRVRKTIQSFASGTSATSS